MSVLNFFKKNIKKKTSNAVKVYVLEYLLKKIDPYLKNIIWIFFFFFLGIFSFLVINFLFILKVITDFNGSITYGSIFLGLLASIFLGFILAYLIRLVLLKKINSIEKNLVKKVKSS